MALCADARLAQRLVHFAPAVAFEEGLTRLLAWYRWLTLPPERLLDQEIERNWRPNDEIRHVG
jgi:hypothetical protein